MTVGMNRSDSLGRLDRDKPWEFLVIGGGATGIGIALDSASRGFDTLLVEQSDFGKGTSSRSTKLVHGGVRYLRQGNIALVRDSLRERTVLRNNAPHLVHDVSFLIPCHSLWQRMFYGIGLKLYDFLAVRNSFGRSHGVSADEAVRLVPTLKRNGLAGGVVYHDGQFDDTRLLINMARTASDHGACLLNYAPVTELLKDDDGAICGVTVLDRETDRSHNIAADCVINATGPFCDAIRQLDDPACEPIISPSQGVHLVLPRRFLPGDTAMIVPKTSDGRVIFIIPWHDHAIVGTTDTPIPAATLEPTAQADEIAFLLETAGRYLQSPPKIDDVLGTFTGIRPLVRGDASAHTASLSRDHTIQVSDSGLVTITGGKWTTVRKMAEDCIDRGIAAAGFEQRACRTTALQIHGAVGQARTADPRDFYGSDVDAIEQLEKESPDLAQPLDDSIHVRGSDVVWAVRHEMARTVEDVLARRTRVLILDPRAAIRISPEVARLMAHELGRDQTWIDSQIKDFASVAQHYILPGSPL